MGSTEVLSPEERWEGLSPPYGTIVADPPWHYEQGGPHSITGRERAVDVPPFGLLSTLHKAFLYWRLEVNEGDRWKPVMGRFKSNKGRRGIGIHLPGQRYLRLYYWLPRFGRTDFARAMGGEP